MTTYRTTETARGKFRFSVAGTPTDPSGLVLSVYDADSTTQSTTGVTTTVPFDSVTGLLHWAVDLSTYAADTDYQVIATAGTLDGKALAGLVVGEFTTRVAPVDTVEISGDATAADNLEAMYDGTGYTDDAAPATQSQVGNLAVGSGGISTTAESFTKASTEPETNTFAATHQLDGTYHIVEDVAGATDVYYEFDVGGNGVPQTVEWQGYAQSVLDSYTVHFYNWGSTSWEQVGTLDAANGTTPVSEQWAATIAHVGTGANLGKVRLRFLSSDGTAIATDRILCTYAVVSKSVGYADGAIWVDTAASNTSTEAFVDGVADNPVSTWAAALTLSTSTGIKRFHVRGGSSITLTGSAAGYAIIGDGLFDLDFNGQSVLNAKVTFARLSGTCSGIGAVYEDCQIQPESETGPAEFIRCGVAATSGSPYTVSGTAGEFMFIDCYSMVAGSGTPYMDFSGGAGAIGVNIRRWAGGTNITLDSQNTLSLEVLGGGGQTITTGGADVEVRGICRALTAVLSGTETVQFVGVTGPIALSGTTTATVNLYGVASDVNDTTSAATVNNKTVTGEPIDANVTQLLGAPAAPDAVLEGKIDTIDALVDQLIGRLTAARAGYLDKLNISGDVAGATPVAAIDALVAAIKTITDQFRFTIANEVDANAVTGGGGGGGGDATEANQDAIVALLEAIQGVGFDSGDSLQSTGTRSQNIWAWTALTDAILADIITRAEATSDKEEILTSIEVAAGVSPTAKIITFGPFLRASDNSPIDGVEVWVTTGAEPGSTALAQGYTDTNGLAVLGPIDKPSTNYYYHYSYAGLTPGRGLTLLPTDVTGKYTWAT